MCAKYADDLRASEPELVEPDLKRENHPGSVINLRHARHPLLEQAQVVPIDVILDPQTFALVITGPNTGGKTVTLKTVGLMVVMAQSGLHIPAQSGSSLSIFQDIYADIGDEQSIEQSLSTFSAHITNIVRVLGNANRETLVLFDELGAGTDPQEGAALARALLSLSGGEPHSCLVATHYPELKTFAHATPGVVNASMEFDLRTLRPHIISRWVCLGRSNALLIAETAWFCLPAYWKPAGRDQPAGLAPADLLDEIHRQRDLARK
jgi:DNA mismatch repair protein MutS2